MVLGIPMSAQSTSTSTGTASIPKSKNVLSLTNIRRDYCARKGAVLQSEDGVIFQFWYIKTLTVLTLRTFHDRILSLLRLPTE